MGYAVHEPGILHWLFVKRDYRGAGIGTALLRETVRSWGDLPYPLKPLKYTFRTRASQSFLGEHWTWDPVLARVKNQ